MVLKIHIAATIAAMEDNAEVLLVVHRLEEETTMEVMEANPRLVTIKFKMVPNQHVGTATSMGIIKRTVTR